MQRKSNRRSSNLSEKIKGTDISPDVQIICQKLRFTNIQVLSGVAIESSSALEVKAKEMCVDFMVGNGRVTGHLFHDLSCN